MTNEIILIRGGRIIDPSQGLDKVTDMLLANGLVSWIGSAPAPQTPTAIIDATGLVVVPGFVDLHCHLREPGFEEKETIATGTRAAARGGFTTICCMPNTEPPVDSGAVVDFILRRAREAGQVRVLPIGCVSKGRRGQELAEMGELAAAGAVAFSDDGSPVANSLLMRHALEYSRAFGLPVIDHCEDAALTQGAVMNEGAVATRLGLKGWPATAEDIIVARDIALAQLTGGRLHIAHVSTAGAVDLIRRAREKGIAVTAEVTPHHLTLTEECVMGYNTAAKVNPPLRTEADRRALVGALKEGIIDAIATDHAPHDAVSKECEFDLAAFGISGLETALGSLIKLVHNGELDLVTVIAKLTAAPAAVLGQAESLGTLVPGAPADVAIFDPKIEWVVEPERFASKGKNTPLAGTALRGKVVTTIGGGKIVYQEESRRVERIPGVS